jgi:HEPN domain-containing protein
MEAAMYENMYLMNNHAYVIEQQQSQEQQKKAMAYYGRICSSARSMRDEYVRGDYNDACASAEQLTEYSLDAIAEMNGGLDERYMNHRTLVNRKKEYIPDLEISNNSLRRMQAAYKNKYPDPNTHQIQYNYNQDEARNMIKDAMVAGEEALNVLNIPLQERYKQFGQPSDTNNIDSFHLRNLLFNGQTQEYTYEL